ncbi:uncharacterized protein DUF2735 [Neorhizobium sp. R1-B]|uniref:DUF2735 domain-containing protein n=1 Tax=Neorhizobium TaxID=1525371 RepID=UPI000CF8BAF5|nr:MULTISPECIES: DUF2735 domain-containing protein [Neorhizobium]TCV74583.1 uncharacterized protein DUF2735 [Neorhizobium sp. S3-V5DH]TDX87770.1 uncharacterized protein DUF2735 [Neorhizobium sp. R1-B]
MTTDIHRETARIYQFPIRPRRRLDNGATAPSSDLEIAGNVVDTCWYHDEAVKDSTSKTNERPKPC